MKRIWSFTTQAAMLVALGCVLAGSVTAQDGVRDAGSKMRGDYGGPPRVVARGRAMYRPSAPMVVNEAPSTVAQAPSGERRFSAESGTVDARTKCHEHHAAPAAPQAAQQPAPPSQRRYSYEPSTMAAPVYRAPSPRRGFGGSSFPDAGAKMRGDYGR